MSKFETFKNAVEGIVSASVGLVIHTVIAKNTPTNLKFLPRTGMKVGTLVIGSLLSNMAAKKITDGLDGLVAGVKEDIQKVEAERAAEAEAAKPRTYLDDVADDYDRDISVTPKPKRKPAVKKPIVDDI
jgi:hypothetical protein